MSPTDAFSAACAAGSEAYHRGLPRTACPHGTPPEDFLDAADPALAGWACGWDEAETAEREDRAFGQGWRAGWTEQGRCPFVSAGCSRLAEAWAEGWAQGATDVAYAGLTEQ